MRRRAAEPGGPEFNTDERFIANRDDSTAFPLRVSAQKDGSFTVSNPRNGQSKAYKPRP